MSTVIYFLNRKTLLVLVSAAVFVALTSLGIFLHGKMLDGMHEKQRMYQTAIKTENGEEFNYSIDTKQGNVMTYGTFHFVDFVKFSEMTKKFSYVKKTKEEYTRHTYETCDDDGSCTTHTYYSWDYRSSETREGEKVKFFDRQYNTSMFQFGSTRSIPAEEIVKDAKGHYLYPNKRTNIFGFEVEGNVRYKYDVRGENVTGSIFVNTYSGLRAAEGDTIVVQRESIEERVKKVATEAALSSVGFIIFWIILTVGATIGVTYWWIENIDY